VFLYTPQIYIDSDNATKNDISVRTIHQCMSLSRKIKSVYVMLLSGHPTKSWVKRPAHDSQNTCSTGEVWEESDETQRQASLLQNPSNPGHRSEGTDWLYNFPEER
jgi:hypothetical protein